MQNTSIIFYLFDSLIRESHKYINSVKGHKEEDLITGRFVEIVLILYGSNVQTKTIVMFGNYVVATKL